MDLKMGSMPSSFWKNSSGGRDIMESGIKGFTETSALSKCTPASRTRISNFLNASSPPRSSAGLVSVRPSIHARYTKEAKVPAPGMYSSKMRLRVQDTTASRERISSDELVPRAMDSRIGSAAPTVVSYLRKTPFSRAAAFMAA